jgi:hypothetical protein
VTAARFDMLDRALGLLSEGTIAAVAVLRSLLASKTADDRVRLQAACAILEASTRLRDSVEMERRIAELERQQASKDDNQAKKGKPR